MKSNLSAWQVYRRLLGAVRPYTLMFFLGILGNVGFALADSFLVYAMQPLLDVGFVEHSKPFFKILPFALLGLVVLRGLVSFMAGYCMSYVGRKVVMDFRQNLFAHLLYLPTSFFDNNPSGELLAKLTYNTDQVANASTDAVKVVVKEGATVVFLLGLMFYHSWKLSLLFLVAGPCIYLTTRYASARFRRLSQKTQESIGSITHAAEEIFIGNKVVKIFGAQSEEISAFNKKVLLNFRQEMKMATTKAMNSPVVQVMAGVILAVVVYLASLKSMTQTISPGAFVSMLAAMVTVMRPLRQLTDVSNTVQRGIAAAESIFRLLDERTEVDKGEVEMKKSKGSVRFQSVSFRYANNLDNTLENISFDIKPGETVALVGRSGAGKTTLVNLLPCFYDGTVGSITIDGTDIRKIKLNSLREQIALVSQHVVLFNDTVARNIAYGQGQRSRSQIERVAKQAHILEFAEHLEKGLDTLIGENGVKLSGGQRQRIAIARALLKDAPILILDEATSALDTESERTIQAALATLIRNKTTLVIAHRLSTIEHADKIVVLEKGCIVEMGTHQELLEQGGHYTKLYRLQFKHEISQHEIAHADF